MMLPINLRDADQSGDAGNQLAVTHVTVPLGVKDPRRRIKRIRKLVEERRPEPGFDFSEAFAGAVNLTPRPLANAVFGSAARSVDFIASCVPGPKRPLYVAGARAEAIFPFGPTSATPANITLFSLGEDAAVTINADPAAVPDHDVLADCMRDGFDEILGLAGAEGGGS